jgi:multidrug efflux pump subunit AcrA (membrane-fusion protein)
VELTGDRSEALTVPRDALITKSDGTREVWRVITEADVATAKPVKVEVGRALGDRVEVLGAGLKAGDRIVMLGNERLRPGQRVLPHDLAASSRPSEQH